MRILPDVGEFCLVPVQGRPGTASVTVALTGLTDGYAEIGRPAGYVSTIGQAPSGGVKWSGSPDPAAPATYGTGATALDFAAGDGGRLYLHLTHQGTTYTRFAPIRQAVAPSVLSAPGLSGAATEGAVLTGTAASFSGPGLVVSHLWEDSANGATGWNATGTSGLTSPVLAAGRHYRLVAVATNTRGTAQAVSAPVGPVQADLPSSASTILESITVGMLGNRSLPVTLMARGARNGDAILWSLAPAAGGPPVADNGAAPVLWPGALVGLPAGIARGQYVLTVTVGDSVPGTSAPFTVDTVAPSLSAPTAAAAAEAITWGVTTTEPQGTIHAALRLAATAAGDAQAIIAGTGYIATALNETPAVDSNNGGAFAGPADGTYRVDMVQVDDFGNTSPVVSSASVTKAPPATIFTDDFNSYTSGQLLTAANGSYGVWDNRAPVVNANGQLSTVNNTQYHGAIYNGITLAANQYVQADFPDMGLQARLYARVTNNSNLYYVRFIGPTSEISIRKRVTGSSEQPVGSTATITPAGTNRIRFEIEGTALRVYHNTALVISATDTGLATGTRAALSVFGNSGLIDNFATGDL